MIELYSFYFLFARI